MSVSLKIVDLVRRFGGLTATDHLHLRIEPGESVGLIGPNGAGKTTIFSQIMGDLRPDEGDIVLDGTSILRLGVPARVRRGISRTFQVPRPFAEMSVAENIRVGLMPYSVWQLISRGPSPEREAEIAMSVGFAREDLERLPSELSMGDLRKLELARALASGPRLVLLDEVFAGLTAGEIAMVSKLIQSLRKDGLTFLIVSHDLKALEPLIDRTVALNQGRKIAEGRYEDVICNAEVKSSYLGQAQ